MIVALAGGVGGAKLASGLAACLGPGELTVIVNTADDFDLYGLRICPDLDTVMYTLAGVANPATGWGVIGDEFTTLDMIGRYGRDPWFRLGDKDFATHILRTEGLRAGLPLSTVIRQLAEGLGVEVRILPMSDDQVATVISTPDGDLEFQEYFVRRHHEPVVTGVHFRGVKQATPSPTVLSTLESAELIVVCPSNPLVSVAPILAVPGVRAALGAAEAPKVAVSPIVGGSALRGPADRMLESLGYEVSPVGVARLYEGLLDGFVMDRLDEALASEVGSLGFEVLATNTVMQDQPDREALADEVLRWGRTLARGGKVVR